MDVLCILMIWLITLLLCRIYVYTNYVWYNHKKKYCFQKTCFLCRKFSFVLITISRIGTFKVQNLTMPFTRRMTGKNEKIICNCQYNRYFDCTKIGRIYIQSGLIREQLNIQDVGQWWTDCSASSASFEFYLDWPSKSSTTLNLLNY